MTTIQLHYKKEHHINLDSLAKSFTPETSDSPIDYNPFHIRDIQNYNPIYGRFFELSESNYNKITLNQKYGIRESGVVERETETILDKPVFFKFAPLLDPIRYMIGKYDLTDPVLKQLPSISNTDKCFPKIADPNNVSYVDSFFCYLGSQLLEKHNVFHAMDFYGSYVGIQAWFKTNITDEMEYLHSSEFFEQHLNSEFYVDNDAFAEYMGYGSRKHRKRIHIDSRASNISLGAEELNVLSDEVSKSNTILDELAAEEIYEKHNRTASTETTSTSQNSAELNYSSDEEEEEESEEQESKEDGSKEPESEEEGSEETCSTDEVESFGFIKDFPTQMICMEKCDGTLDELFVSDSLDVDQSAACLFQVIMTLIVFQKAFHFTHNDLHTNNIMYVRTDVEYLYYCYNHKYYRVPTYGRIFKIIDFGRSIYKFQGKTFCSDSFAPCGDAYAQYNCEPYMNNNKPRIDPNPSFDLCRLGCSIFDFTVEDMDHPKTELQKTIVRWCSDDNGRNVLYKRNGEERYPSFKLYKMIARNVHRHTPHEQLKFPYFRQFEVPLSKMKEIGASTILQHGINIDEIPVYTC